MTVPNTRIPGTYLEENTKNAVLGLFPVNDKVVVIAQELASGSVDAGIPTSVFSDADAALYFGQGSVAHLTAKAAFEANPNVSLSIVGVDDDGSAQKAAGTLIFDSTTVTKSGTLTVWVGDLAINMGYASGAVDGTSLANSFVTAAASYTNLLPVTVSKSDSTVTFTAKNGGTVGNCIALSSKDSVGQNFSTITSMSNGSTDPDVGAYDTTGTIMYALAAAGYAMIVNTIPNTQASHDSATKVEEMVDWASGAMEERPAIQVMAATDLVDTYANIKTLCGTDLNAGRCTCAYIDYTSDDLAKTEYFKVAGAYAAQLASQSDPAVPYDGLILASVTPPSVVDRFSTNQQDDMLDSGITPLTVVPGEQVSICRAISTYTTDSFGQPSIALLDINTIRTLDYFRAQERNRMLQDFQRQKLTDRVLKSIKTEIIDVMYLCEAAGIVQNTDTYKTGVTVGIDSVDHTKVNVFIPADIVQGLHVIAGTIQLII